MAASMEVNSAPLEVNSTFMEIVEAFIEAVETFVEVMEVAVEVQWKIPASRERRKLPWEVPQEGGSFHCHIEGPKELRLLPLDPANFYRRPLFSVYFQVPIYFHLLPLTISAVLISPDKYVLSVRFYE